jgi:hypothetical protein
MGCFSLALFAWSQTQATIPPGRDKVTGSVIRRQAQELPLSSEHAFEMCAGPAVGAKNKDSDFRLIRCTTDRINLRYLSAKLMSYFTQTNNFFLSVKTANHFFFICLRLNLRISCISHTRLETVLSNNYSIRT